MKGKGVEMLTRGKHRQRQRDFDALMGIGTFLPIITIGFVIYFVSVNLINAVIFTIIFLGILSLLLGNVIPVRRITMEMIKKIFGITIIEMKLVALAKFLKIDYQHIPEHYDCKKIEQSQ